MPDTITLLGSLAQLDMQAVVGKPVWVRVHYAPDGKLLGGTEPPGTVLGEPGYAPTGYGSARALVTDEQGLFGGVLPWEDGGIYRVDVPGDVTRYLMMGTGAGEYPAGSTVNVRLLPGPDEVVTPSVTLDALVVGVVEDYLTAHPPTGGGSGQTLSTLSERAAPPTRKAVAAGTIRIVVMGDSKIEGVGASDREHSWQRKLLATLRATYGSADTGYGYWPAISGHPFVVPNPALAGATATALPNAYGLGMKAVRLGINDTLTYPAQQATKITVFYSRTMFFGGTADVLIDGAVVGSINSAGAEESGRTVAYTVSAGAHTVQIKGTSGSASAVVEGVLFETASSGVKMYDGAHGGYRADLYAQGGADIGSYDADDRHYEAVAAVNPHLVLIGLGANDMAGVSGGFGVPVNATAFGSYLLTIVTRLRAAAPGCAIVFVMSTRRLEDTTNPEILTDHEEAARKAIGSLPGVTILYESSLWLPNTSAPQDDLGWLADSVHPSDLGHAEIARHVADRLGEDPRLADARTPTGAAGGGLAGTYPNPTVAAVRGVTVSATAPTAGQVLTASSGTAAGWTTPAAGAGDATTTTKGVVQLAGDLAGTAAAPTVAKVNGTTPAATGLALLGAASAAAAKTTLALVKADVGLSNVDNTSDADKPISTATATAISALAPKANPALTATTPAPVLTTVTTPALSGWTLTGSATYSAGSITVGPASGSLSTDIPVTNDTVYQIDLTTSASTGGDVTVSLGAASATYPAAGITSVTIAATETGTRTLTIGGTTWSATITGVTVRELTRQSPAATIGAAEVRAWGTNTGLGSGVHRAITTGINNTGIGYGAQYGLTTGRYNTGIGYNAQYGLTTGRYNTGIGYNAQYGLTTGLYNTGIGYGAQRAITTGANNTGIGMNAQYSLTAGGSNVAIGYGAQYTPAGNGTNATTTGARQVSIGVETGQSVSTQLNDITTLGHRSRAGADFGTAVGSGAHAAHLRSVALGSTTTTTADDQVMVGARDVEITSATCGVILQSPNGTRYRVTVTDAGALTVSAV